MAALIEEMAKADAGFATTISASGLGTQAVLIAGNEEQKKRACQLIMDGGFGAFCLTEPGAGSDASAGKTTAVKDGRQLHPQRPQVLHHQRRRGLLLLRSPP